MSNDLKDLLKAGESLLSALQRFDSEFERFEDSCDTSTLSMEERSQLVRLRQAHYSMDVTQNMLKGLGKPVRAEGALRKQPHGRYLVEDVELTSGYPLEVYDPEDDVYYPTRLEHSGDDYYIVELGREEPIEGKLVRLR